MIRYIPISDIHIANNRQRREFDQAKLNELGDSIARLGLLHAIVLRRNGDTLTLVAGERRVRALEAMSMLGLRYSYNGEPVPPGEVPYTLLSDLSPLEAEEAELEENTHRVDLSWQEKAAATTRLMELRQAQAIARNEPPPTLAALTEELHGVEAGRQYTTTRKELALAKHLDRPEIAAAKSVDEAWKLLQKEEAREKRAALGAEVGKNFSTSVHRCVHADSLVWMCDTQAEQFDVILTDPPYGMGADEFGDSGTGRNMAHGYADTPELFDSIMQHFPRESFRIAKPLAHLYWFCDIYNFEWIKEALSHAGWQVFRTPLIWYKRTGMRAPWPLMGPQRKYEIIVYAVKGKRPVTKMAPDVIECPPDPNLGHMAQKPVALYQELLSRSVAPGDRVCDPFCGSGPIFAAAHALKCFATGVEIDQASYGLAVERINKLGE